MLSLLMSCFALGFVAVGLLVRYSRHAPGAYAATRPQRFHWGEIPRIGGVGIFTAFSLGWPLLLWVWPQAGASHWDAQCAFGWWVVCALMLLTGTYEDMTQRFAVRWRLVATFAGAALAVLWLELSVSRLGWPGIDAGWTAWGWPGLLLAAVAIAGLPHAFNLIDGYNGLAGIVAIVICVALAYVAMQVGDRALAAVVLMLAAATGGFLLWNYPRGLIFAGDGGAYLWGGVIAMVSLQLVQRHTMVSPWFPMLLLIYPVWETLFSIWRKAARGQSPGVADALHFHQLIYRRLVRGVFHDDEARRMLMRNNRTSPYLWGFAMLTVVPAVIFWHNTPVLMAFCLLFIISYVYAYVSIVRFKVPRWLRR